MRVLVTTIPGLGHFTPLIPLLRAMQAAGHALAVATAETFRDEVERAGFTVLPAGDFAIAPTQQDFAEMFVDGFAASTLRARDTLLAWNPDVIVREEGEFAAPVIAALLEVPCVDVGWGPARPRELVDLVGDAMRPYWQQCGLVPRGDNGTYQWLYVDPCPPSMQSPHAESIATRHLMRPVPPPPAATDAPEWIDALERPAVYVTLGTVPRFANDTAFFRAAIDAVSDGFEVIVTVGPRGDPDQLGPQPPHVHVEQFIPQAALLPRCVAAITNGGSGATMGALAFGVPVLAVGNPISPSQVRNADAVAARGAGRTLLRADAEPARLRAEIDALLRDDGYSRVAREVAVEIASMPAPDAVAAAIEQVVETNTPWR